MHEEIRVYVHEGQEGRAKSTTHHFCQVADLEAKLKSVREQTEKMKKFTGQVRTYISQKSQM